MYLSLIIPAYNEGERITQTLDQVSAYFERQPYKAEIIVVDDGSADHTASAVRSFPARAGTPVILESLPKNRGKGFAVRTGMLRVARGEFRFFFDADASTPIEELEQCEALFQGETDIIIGSRALPDSIIKERQRRYRECMGRVFNALERCLRITDFKDTQCGFKGFSRAAVECCFSRQTIDRFSFDAEILFIARKHGLRARELPVQLHNRAQSRVRPVTDASRMFLDLLAIRARDCAGAYQ